MACSKENISLKSLEISFDLKITSYHLKPPTGKSQFVAINFSLIIILIELQMKKCQIHVLLDSLVIPNDLVPNHLFDATLNTKEFIYNIYFMMAATSIYLRWCLSLRVKGLINFSLSYITIQKSADITSIRSTMILVL